MKNKLLYLLFLTLVIKQLVWAVFIPIWQFPDEQAHFAQVQNTVEHQSLKGGSGNSTSNEIAISEKLLGTIRDEFGNNNFTHRLMFNLSFSSDYSRYVVRTLERVPYTDRTKMILKEATDYPPAYYLYISPFYLLSYEQNILIRVIFARIANIPLYVLTIYFAYLTLKRVFHESFQLQIVALLWVSFHPMFSYVSAGVTSDSLYNLLCTVIIWLSIISIEKMSVTKLVLVGITSLLLTYTKPQAKLMLAIIGSSFFLLNVSLKQKKTWVLIGSIGIIFLAGGGAIRNLLSGRQFLPDVQALDTLNISLSTFVSHIKWTMVHTYREVMPWYWGVFRWLSLTYPRVVHRTINWLVLISIMGISTIIFRPHYRRSYGKIAVFMLIINILYSGGLMVFDYLFTVSRLFSFGMQGRYYFPMIVTQMALLCMGVDILLPARMKGIGLWVLGIAAIALHWFAQWYVLSSYTSATNIGKWFYDLSLYKPPVITQGYLLAVYLLQALMIGMMIWNLTKIIFRGHTSLKSV